VLSAAKAGHVQCFALLVANHRSQVGRVRQFGFDLYRLASATHGKTYDVRTDPERPPDRPTTRLTAGEQPRERRHSDPQRRNGVRRRACQRQERAGRGARDQK